MASSSSEVEGDETVEIGDAELVPRRRRKGKQMTVDEYLATPETVLPRELIFGTLRVAEAPLVNHQRTVFALARALHAHVDEHGAGEVIISPVDVVLDRVGGLVLQPDLLVVSSDRSAIVGDRIEGAPDLVIEVLSPTPRIGRLDERVAWFAQHGVREMWLYDQGPRLLTVLECSGGRVSATRRFESHEPVRSQVLPGLDLRMASIVTFW
jgi:Uma2 family endonuclease